MAIWNYKVVEIDAAKLVTLSDPPSPTSGETRVAASAPRVRITSGRSKVGVVDGSSHVWPSLDEALASFGETGWELISVVSANNDGAVYQVRAFFKAPA